jgi:hypothetical protein
VLEKVASLPQICVRRRPRGSLAVRPGRPDLIPEVFPMSESMSFAMFFAVFHTRHLALVTALAVAFNCAPRTEV